MCPQSESDSENLLAPDTTRVSYPLSSLAQHPSTDDNTKPTPSESDGGQSLQRFWTRSLLLVIFPPVTTAYFFFIWLFVTSDDAEAIKYGHRNARGVYYSWFIVGVFGLNASMYGLAGIEAAMVRRWQVDDAMVLLMHSGQSWSGLGGWFKWLCRRKKVHWIWYPLAFLSLMVTAALPLSGLSMELFDGHVKTSENPMVIGYRFENFNSRQSTGWTSPYSSYYQTVNRGASSWSIGGPVTIPGIGIAYTASYLRRKQFDSLKELPNSLPLDKGVPDLFLAPQATAPVSGRAWGLRLGYNCSVVKSASEFTILRNSDEFNQSNYNETIFAFNSSGTSHIGHNLWSYTEMGVSDDPFASYDGNEPFSFDEDGIHEASVLEYALWQVRLPAAYGDKDFDFNDTVTPFISGIGSPFIQADNGTLLANESFFSVRTTGTRRHIDPREPSLADPTKLYSILKLAPPIGVRCLRVSALGTAELDPASNSFDSFSRSPSPPFNQSLEEQQTPRFGGTAASILVAGDLVDRYEALFTSTGSPAPITVSNSYRYPNFVRPQTLLQSIMRAHAMDALQLMYDGLSTFDNAYLHPNLTASEKGKILGPGAVPSEVSAVLFSIWSLGCIILGCMYGFRRRWSETLDGSFWRRSQQ